VIVFAQGSYGLFYLAEYPLFVGGQAQGFASRYWLRQGVLTKYPLTSQT
jgi:hypothetical protein